MTIGNLCTRTVFFMDHNGSAREAAELMRRHHVGDLVIVDADNPHRVPLGVLTDRDITVEVVAAGVSPESIRAGDIMSRGIITAGENEDPHLVARRMRDAGVRRVPVVGADGALVGILCMDDLLEALAEELSHLTHIPGRQRLFEGVAR